MNQTQSTPKKPRTRFRQWLDDNYLFQGAINHCIGLGTPRAIANIADASKVVIVAPKAMHQHLKDDGFEGEIMTGHMAQKRNPHMILCICMSNMCTPLVGVTSGLNTINLYKRRIPT